MKMIGALLIFFRCLLNYNAIFKIIIEFDIIIIDFKFINDFKSYGKNVQLVPKIINK
jgi:hypothetical protein